MICGASERRSKNHSRQKNIEKKDPYPDFVESRAVGAVRVYLLNLGLFGSRCTRSADDGGGGGGVDGVWFDMMNGATMGLKIEHDNQLLRLELNQGPVCAALEQPSKNQKSARVFSTKRLARSRQWCASSN